MKIWPVIARAILCAALVLNGAVPAIAHVDHHFPASGKAVSPVPAAEGHAQHGDHHAAAKAMDAEHGCHGDAADFAPVEPDDAPSTPAGDLGDCCEQGICTGNCAQHCAASIPPVVGLRTASLESAGAVRPLPAGHRAPPLPHLIRPPIV
ncbi:MAG: CopL family metal-binding regulatory protein [Pseudomonadota bacterium]